jgi:four helix bundle protein
MTNIQEKELKSLKWQSSKEIKSAKDLKVYRKAYKLAMEIFQLTKEWPPEERYSLVDQIRRASRSVCSNLREAWAKRRYEAHFISKLTDADGENSEIDTWLDFALDCGYLDSLDHLRLTAECRQIGAMLGSMLNKPKLFLLRNSDSRPLTSDRRPLTSDP